MKTVTIDYDETYSGTFEVEVDDDATDDDAIRELIDDPDLYHIGDEVELTESNAAVVHDGRPSPDEHVRALMARVADARAELLRYALGHEGELSGLTFVDGEGRPCSASAAVDVTVDRGAEG